MKINYGHKEFVYENITRQEQEEISHNSNHELESNNVNHLVFYKNFVTMIPFI